MAEHGNDPFHHVRDSHFLELPGFLGGELELPTILGLPLTKFMILQVVAGLITLIIFRSLAKNIQGGSAPRGMEQFLGNGGGIHSGRGGSAHAGHAPPSGG